MSLRPLPLFARQGGSGQKLLLLIHGLGSCGTVWDKLIPHVERSWPGRWIAVDLRGHGKSPHALPYTYAAHAADLKALLGHEKHVCILGHSMGGVIGMKLANDSGLDGIRSVCATNVKLEFTSEEVSRFENLAMAGAKLFSTATAAAERYVKVTGLVGLADPLSQTAQHGICGTPQGFRLSMDPAANLIVRESVMAILALVSRPLHLIGGGADPIAPPGDALERGIPVDVIHGAGHNIPLECAELLWNRVAPLLMADAGTVQQPGASTPIV